MNKIYGVVISPFVRKVLMLLEYKQIAYEHEHTVPNSTDKPFTQISPLGKVPAFSDEYTALADSSIICDYLEHKYPQHSLYPKTPVARAKTLWFEEYADTHLMQLLGPGLFFERLVAPTFFKRAPNQALIESSLKALPAVQDYLEAQIPATGFLVGADLTIADLTLPGVFLNAKYASYEVDARRWPKLAAYLQRMYTHPLYEKRIAQEREVFGRMIPQ